MGAIRVGPDVPVKPGAPAVDETAMKALLTSWAKLARDERGGEVLEYALVAGLIVIAAIAVIGSVGTKVLARWNSVNSSL
jgi:Flp pilus assembly pilin Flp